MSALAESVTTRDAHAVDLDAIAALERAVARATAVRGERGEASEVAARLLRQVEEAERAFRVGTAARGMR